MPYKVAICRFPGSGWEHCGLVSWLMNLSKEIDRDMRSEAPTISGVEMIVEESDTPITMMRNRAVKRALEAGCDYILMADSDMIPDYLVGRTSEARPFWQTAWAWMMARRADEEAHRIDIAGPPGDIYPAGLRPPEERAMLKYPPATIAAPYCGPPPHELVFIFKWKDFASDEPDITFRLEMIEREEAFFRSGIERAAALPTGLILYDARVFEISRPKTMADDPWFDYEWGDVERTIKASTEDVFQTRNACLEHNLPQYVLWDSWAIHVKTKHVKKPNLITREMVRKGLTDAALRERAANERLHFVSRHDAAKPRLPTP